MTETNAPTFTESYDALDGILEKFKQGNTPLEEALALFETGVTHLKNCQDKLTQAKGKVEVLVQSLQEGGESVTEPFMDLE